MIISDLKCYKDKRNDLKMAATYVFSLQNNEATEYRKKEEHDEAAEYRKKEEGRRREGNARKG